MFPHQVTFLITEDPSRTRVRREVLATDRFDLYVDLARSSGGQVIFTDNANIQQVAGIIGETTASSVWRGDPGIRDGSTAPWVGLETGMGNGTQASGTAAHVPHLLEGDGEKDPGVWDGADPAVFSGWGPCVSR